MPICLRVDDFPGSKPAEFWKHNRHNFELFDNVICETLGVSYLLGVIPVHTSDEDLRWLSKRNIVIGIHGTTHDENLPNQFEGRDYLSIRIELEHHVRRLREVTWQKIETYMPPHNLIDTRTLAVCEILEFKAFTTGPETMDYTCCHTKLKRLDSNCSNPKNQTWKYDYGRSDELLIRGSVENLKQRHDSGELIYLTLHWPWEHAIGLHHLRTYLERIRDLFIDFQI